jgi:hypothetical protein
MRSGSGRSSCSAIRSSSSGSPADFATAGMVGEETNCLVGYLAAVSRKLDRPLAVIVQSTSAAGKSALQDAVLGFVPDEERVAFSAMTGQSLFYMGEIGSGSQGARRVARRRARSALLRAEAPAVEGELSIASTGQGRDVGPAGDAHLPGQGAGGDLPDDDRGRRRRGAAEPLHRLERR